MSKHLEAETLQGIDCFEQALAIAPDYAAAYASLAGAYFTLSIYSSHFPSDTYPKVREYAARALAIDPASAEARLAQGRLKMLDWDWENAEANFALALAAGGGAVQSSILDSDAFVLLYRGRTVEAVAQSKRAVELDPLNVQVRQNLGEVLYYARHYDDSIAASLAAIAMDPLYPQAHLFLGMAYAAKGDSARAVRAIDRDAEISAGQRPEVESWLAVGYALAGQVERSRQLYSGDADADPLDRLRVTLPACLHLLSAGGSRPRLRMARDRASPSATSGCPTSRCIQPAMESAAIRGISTGWRQ